jgi:hypothetical protein
MSSRNGRPLFLIENDLTGRRVASHSYQRPVITGLVLLQAPDFFGQGNLCHVLSSFLEGFGGYSALIVEARKSRCGENRSYLTQEVALPQTFFRFSSRSQR